MTATPSVFGRALQTCRRLWRALRGPGPRPTILQSLRRFFGHDLEPLETHDKHFPGYDIASLARALDSFFEDCCTESWALGSCRAPNMRALLDWFKSPYSRNTRPDPPTYQRVAMDVEEEVSVVINGLYLCVMRPEAGAGRPRKSASLSTGGPAGPGGARPEKVAVLVAVSPGAEHYDGMEANRVPLLQVTVSIACRSRDVADRFFDEVDGRRKRLSVYRGKVIDPALHNGIIYSLGFRAVKRVREQDLVLPESIKRLLHNSIVGFYDHADLLEGLGVEMKRGVLLHGPPGTGKTSIGLYLAGLLPGFTVCFVSGERLLYPREVCRMARYLQPAMVVFEDIDLVANERDANGLATVLGELMNQIDGCDPTDRVLFLMNTNSLERLESAVRNRPGRVDQIVEVPLPDRPARATLLASFAGRVSLPAGDLGPVLDATRDMTPAMLKEIVKRAVVLAVEREGGPADGRAVALSEADLLLAAEQVQVMRAPLAVPGDMGFRRQADGRHNHEEGKVPR